jgi:type II secretory pathway pseudopilin PulG
VAMGKRLRFRNDDGLAMFSVLAVSGIAALLALVSVTAATGTNRRTHRDQRREQAISLAEAGVARAMAELEASRTYFTTAAVPPVPLTRAWVLAQGSVAPIANGKEGQYAWIVPQSGGVAFGIGYVPSRAQAFEARVVRVGIDEIHPFGELSLLSAGNATINGNVDIDVGGSVHSNANLTLMGSSDIAGNATSTGAFSKSGGVDIGGVSGGGFAPYEVPPVDPRAHRFRTTTDLCPDGTVKSTAPTPCTGTVIGSGVLGWNGWTWHGTEWRIAGNNAGNGGFYVYRANARISGNVTLWNGTIVVEGSSVAGVLVNGDFAMTGTTEIAPSSQGVAIVASRDVTLSGDGKVNGLTIAGEQVSMAGNVEVRGQVIAASASSSSGSPVSATSLSGNVTITAEVHAPNQGGGFASTEWAEL